MNQTQSRFLEFFIIGTVYSILGFSLVILVPNMRFLSVILVIAGFAKYVEESLDETMLTEGAYHV